MSDKSRLEVFLALNAEAFRRGLGGAVTATQAGVGQIAGIFSQNRGKIDENTAAIKRFTAENSQLSGVVGGLRGAFSALLAPLAAAVSLVAGMQKLVEVTREFDKLNAGLVTATGSAAGAKVAFAAIQDFAAKTPYDLAQVTDSFVKLVNFGLNPSERSLASYGNTASALGKDLNQMIEAVADAATGEFERLKEFGIKVKKEGDYIAFTFRGVTTTVANNTQEIEEYLIKLGEVNFGDAMANRMATLDGAMSNLGDAWNKLWLNISQTGIGEEIAKSVRLVSEVLDELSAKIVSGELLANLEAMAGKWKGWADDVAFSIRYVRELFATETGGILGIWKDLVGFLITAFKEFPENVRALVGLATVAVASEFDKIKAKASWLMDSVKAIFTDQTLEGAVEKYNAQLKAINEAKEESIRAILKERDTALASYDQQTKAAKKLREEHDKTQAAARSASNDRLADFKVKAPSPQEQEEAKRELAREANRGKYAHQPEQKKKPEPTPEEKKKADEEKKAKQKKAEETKGGGHLQTTSDAKKLYDDKRSEKDRLAAARSRLASSSLSRDFDDSDSFFDDEPSRRRGRGRRDRRDRDDRATTSTLSGAISAHGGALTDEQWKSLSREQQQTLLQAANQPRKSFDYFNNKSGDRFRGVGDTNAFLANMAKNMLALNQTQAAQAKWIAEKTGAGIGGRVSASIRSQLSSATGGDQRPSSATRSTPAKIHELRFKGGSLQGSQSDIEALLEQLAKAGLSAS